MELHATTDRRQVPAMISRLGRWSPHVATLRRDPAVVVIQQGFERLGRPRTHYDLQMRDVGSHLRQGRQHRVQILWSRFLGTG
jgi:hypothetical protein